MQVENAQFPLIDATAIVVLIRFSFQAFYSDLNKCKIVQYQMFFTSKAIKTEVVTEI